MNLGGCKMRQIVPFPNFGCVYVNDRKRSGFACVAKSVISYLNQRILTRPTRLSSPNYIQIRLIHECTNKTGQLVLKFKFHPCFSNNSKHFYLIPLFLRNQSRLRLQASELRNTPISIKKKHKKCAYSLMSVF